MQIRIENNREVYIYEDDARVACLGTMLPNDEQLLRVIHRAIEFGKNLKSAEVRKVLGVHLPR